MGKRLEQIMEEARSKKGHFFVARLNLHLSFPISVDMPDDEKYERELVEMCRLMGFDPSPIKR